MLEGLSGNRHSSERIRRSAVSSGRQCIYLNYQSTMWVILTVRN